MLTGADGAAVESVYLVWRFESVGFNIWRPSLVVFLFCLLSIGFSVVSKPNCRFAEKEREGEGEKSSV